MDPFTRHKQMMELYKNPTETQAAIPKSDYEELRQHFQFLPEELPPSTTSEGTWQSRLVRAYHDGLFKEFCLADLSLARSENRVALCWRTEEEVVRGKGQFSCGNVACASDAGLASYEVNFGYFEGGTKRNALVKLCLCPTCAAIMSEARSKRA